MARVRSGSPAHHPDGRLLAHAASFARRQSRLTLAFMKNTACFAALLALLAAPAAFARPMTEQDVARTEAVAAMAVAPDGSRIAYLLASFPDVTQGEKDGKARLSLQLAWGPGQERDYLPADMNVGAARFSPDGKLIAFLWADKGGKDAVWGIPVDGGGHRKLAEVAGANVLDFAWSPDGATLYLLADPGEDARRKAEVEAGFDAQVFEEDYRFNRLFAARVSRKPDRDPRPIAVPGFVSGFKLSPDGRRALIETAPSPSVDDSYTRKRLQLIDLPGGVAGKMIQTEGKIGDYEWSPDGKAIALIAATDSHDPAPTTLYLVDTASGAMRALNQGAAEAAQDAQWLADGRLAAVIHLGAQSRYRTYRADGTPDQELDPGPLILQSLAAAGGTIALRADSPAHPEELFVLRDGAFQRWTHHNPWLSDIDFGAQRTLSYTARDGQRIEGILIEPVGGVKKGGAPTILDVHGGPEAHESNGWITNYGGPGQVAAARGYAVFLPNYRGSTAYGSTFSRQHQGDFAGKEFDDLVDAKRALVAAGVTDPARVGITGGSYGGYATAWGATAQSEEYAAAVMFVGLSDNISKFGTTEIPNEMHLVHELAWPWEEWQFMLERSPIYQAGKAKTPLLILHGLKDTRVDPGQSLELYRHIKTRTDTPVRLVLYPGEGHGNRAAAARYDYNLRMMGWFDRYLLGKGDKGDGRMPPARLPLPTDKEP